MESYPPQAPFLKDHISAPRGRCAPKSLHALEKDQLLLAHPHRGRDPLTPFFKKGVINWP